MSCIDNFNLVTVDEYIQIAAKNKATVIKDVEGFKADVADMIRRRDAKCHVCGCKGIWILGSALSQSPTCFTCLTGEADASDDYEVK